MEYWYNPKLGVYFSKETYELMQSKGFVGELTFEEAIQLELDELRTQMQDVPVEFEETFKKNFYDLLA
jgi:hypothetical protein